jgi:hypothetical protein
VKGCLNASVIATLMCFAVNKFFYIGTLYAHAERMLVELPPRRRRAAAAET